MIMTLKHTLAESIVDAYTLLPHSYAFSDTGQDGDYQKPGANQPMEGSLPSASY